jgi:hypothetical protein
MMSNKLENIQTLIYELTKEERGRLREWFDEFDGDTWDLELKSDEKNKKLSLQADKAKKDFKEGKSRDV